ncbi:hypothetical protein [Streptomyces anthocyanicus]|uniref:hypothetical protein n=1 Tax=Streptomyces anthocyanicus TaxID=68174 RepID=UPI002F90D7BC|nr:hypothetical protein OH747_39630 [Streptomyces anthocyanicus]
MDIAPNAVAAARAYASDISGAPLPPPSPADDDGPLKPAHEAAFYLGMGETFRVLTHPGEPASPEVKELSTAVRAVPGTGTWYRRGDEAARRIVTSNRRIRTLPQDPDQLWALLADVLQALDQHGQAPQLDGSNLRRAHLLGRPAAIRHTDPTGGWGPVRVQWNPDGACRWTDLHHGSWQWPRPTTPAPIPDAPHG